MAFKQDPREGGSYSFKVLGHPYILSTYKVIDHAGAIKSWGNTAPEIAIDDTIKSLSSSRLTDEYRQKILLQGYFPDMAAPSGEFGCINIPDFLDLELQGRVKMGASVNKPLISNKNRSTYNRHVRIEGGIWDGNRGQNTLGHGIDWLHSENNTSGDPWCYLYFKHMQFFNIDEDAIHISGASGKNFMVFTIEDVTQRSVDGWGLYLYRVQDYTVKHCLPLGPVYIHYAHSGHLHDLYLNGGMQIWNSNHVWMSDTFLDMDWNLHTWSALDCHCCVKGVFNHLKFSIGGDLGTDLDAIRLNKDYYDSIENQFDDVLVKQDSGSPNNNFEHGINEVDANQNKNSFHNVRDRTDAGCNVAVLRVQGPDSEFSDITGKVVFS